MKWWDKLLDSWGRWAMPYTWKPLASIAAHRVCWSSKIWDFVWAADIPDWEQIHCFSNGTDNWSIPEHYQEENGWLWTVDNSWICINRFPKKFPWGSIPPDPPSLTHVFANSHTQVSVSRTNPILLLPGLWIGSSSDPWLRNSCMQYSKMPNSEVKRA